MHAISALHPQNVQLFGTLLSGLTVIGKRMHCLPVNLPIMHRDVAKYSKGAIRIWSVDVAKSLMGRCPGSQWHGQSDNVGW